MHQISDALIVDIFPEKPGAAVATKNITRCALGGFFVAVLDPMLKAMEKKAVGEVPSGQVPQRFEMLVSIKRQRNPYKQSTRWLYKGLDRQKCLRTIAPAGLVPCDELVTSQEETKVLGTFCWTSKKTIRVPGGEPVFQNVQLPAVLPRAPNLKAAGKIKTMPPHIFAPLAQSITRMSPSYHLRNTDLVVSRNSLRKLFALCAGRSHDSFRIGLDLIKDTLVMTMDDRVPWHPGVTRSNGLGLSFEISFSKPLSGREGDQVHHRTPRRLTKSKVLP
ncbi:uncharacterized protein PgNI_04444 [Pyricularia grisea]|uniref:Uncharacterized protein n=1 Tax=Pyricularia grisea TaxID=148305 RepID=A0A6P8BAP1_PYRGI|nr:uncharacterized protein PgNI_04444 [Pyricularia grisea]TLD12869.1 hypothetical protein PgNI_04444 [Pyricularia grisea]